VVHGNIYVADPKCSGGLIGNNFPEEGGKAEDVKKNVFCLQCFLRALGLSPKGEGFIKKKSDMSKYMTEMVKNGKNNW